MSTVWLLFVGDNRILIGVDVVCVGDMESVVGGSIFVQ